MKKILIIDDDVAIVDAVSIVLHDAGYETAVIQEQVSIPEMVRQTSPDLILLDIWMSGNNGIDIAREIKDNRTTNHIPIILMSALTDGKKISKAAAVDDYITKPFLIDDLLKKIKALLQ